LLLCAWQRQPPVDFGVWALEASQPPVLLTHPVLRHRRQRLPGPVEQQRAQPLGLKLRGPRLGLQPNPPGAQLPLVLLDRLLHAGRGSRATASRLVRRGLWGGTFFLMTEI
jgi:hypothetical protein